MSRTITDPLGDEVQQAWARCAILLKAGDMDAATEAGIAASKATHWHRRFGEYSCEPNVRVYGSALIDRGWIWAEPGTRHRIVINDKIRSQHGHDVAMWDMANGLMKIMTEPGWRRYSPRNWAEDHRLHFRSLGWDEDGFELPTGP